MDDTFKGCLFISDFGVFKVFCDFTVICIKDVHLIAQGEIVTVTNVKSTESGKVAFEIFNDYYYHFYFTLFVSGSPPFNNKIEEP